MQNLIYIKSLITSSLEQTIKSHSFTLKSDQPIISKASLELWHYQLEHAEQEEVI
jgi:hypothetical protein